MTRLVALALLVLLQPASARDLKLATWNVEWLTLREAGDPALPNDVTPKTEADRAQMARYAAALDADVVALEEVDGPAAAATLFPRDRYNLFFTGDSVLQRVGFAVKRSLRAEQNPDLVALDTQPNARFPLRSGADLTLVVDGVRLRFLAVHLKSGCHDAPLGENRSCRTLAHQLPPLLGWIAQRRAEGAPFVLLGDFNRVMDDPADPWLRGLLSGGPLLRATEGHATPCWGGNTFIDHIFLGGPARTWLVPDSLRVMTYREGREQRDHLSDHCPVSVRLRLP